MKPAAFSYADPRTVSEAVGLLGRVRGEACVLAGGQSLIPELNLRVRKPRVVIDINYVGELVGISERDGTVRIGALTRHAELERNPLIAEQFPLLREAAARIGTPAIRARGTVGGSLAFADPSAQLPAVLAALGASIHGTSASDEQSYEAATFALGPNRTRLRDDAILTHVLVRFLGGRVGSAYREATARGVGPPIVGCACVLRLDDGGDAITEARIWLSGVASTPFRSRAAEDRLVGAHASEALVGAAAGMVATGTSPPSDVRASAAYREAAARALTKRALFAALARARACPN